MHLLNILKKNWKILVNIMLWSAVLCLITEISTKQPTKIITYNKFIQQVKSGDVEEVVLSNNPTLSFKLKNDLKNYSTDNPRKEDLKEFLLINNVNVAESSVSTVSILRSTMSIAFLAGMVYYFSKMTNKDQAKTAMAVTEVSSCEKNNLLKFTDVAGNEEAKDSVSDIIDFIKQPDKYSKYGAKMPKGLMFYGPPGTGKTLMAKAIAGEAGVPFFAVSGSDFIQMYVGVGASRIRELFSKARKAEKAVIFIDEIDAVGKKRSSGAGGSNDERDQTLNALLTEMSGFSSTDGIVVIAATNRLDTLDEALLRPGRFDRHIEIGLPDVNARTTILKYYIKERPVDCEVKIENIAKQTVYFSGAMLENLVNEASIFAAKSESESIKLEHFDKAYYTIIAGSEKKDRSSLRQKDREITAYHEAGHALVTKMILPENSVSKVTIIPSTKGAGGFSLNIPPDKMFYTKRELEAQIMVSFAGRAAEEIIFGSENITTGASNDIEKATSIAKDYIVKYGMSEKKGLINCTEFRNDKEIMDECVEMLEKLYKDTILLLNNNLEFLENIAKSLLEKETLVEEDLDLILS